MSKASPLASSVTHFTSLIILAAVMIAPVALRFSKVPGKLITPVHEIPAKQQVESKLAPAGVAATDTDGDGIPDDWENTHFLNSNDAADASSDFDIDGVTALEEYFNASNSLGKWKKQAFAPPANLASATISPIAINDIGQLLVTATNIGGSSTFKTYLVQTPANIWTEITPPGFVAPGDIKGQDLNDRGDVLLRWNDASGIHGALRTANGQFQALTDGAGHPATGFRLNNSGEWVGLRNSDSAAVSFINGVSRVVDNMGAAYSYCGINDYGETVGTYSDGMGSDRVFLEGGGTLFSTGFPGDYPFFDPVQNTWNIPSSLNNDGVFGGSVSQMSSTRIYLYDGRYESFTVSGNWPADSAARVDDFGRLLTYSGTLYRDGVAVPLSSLNPGGTYPLTAAVISRSGIILTKQPGSSTLIVLASDQDQDGDGMSDDWEDIYGLRKDFAGDATLDNDGDGVNNLGEYLLARNPNVNEDVPAGSPTPDLRPGIDSDGDGIPNVWEWEHGLNYQDASDAESHPLTYKTDPDRDGYSNLQEYKLGTDPKGAPAFRVKELGAIPFATHLDFSQITLGNDGTSDQLVLAGTRAEGTFPLRWQARQGAASGISDWYGSTTSQSSILAASTSGAVVMSVGGTLTYWESQNKAPRTISGLSTDTSALSFCKLSPSGYYLIGNRVKASNQTATAFIWHMGDSSSYGVPVSLPLPAGIAQIDFSSMAVNDAAYVVANGTTTGGVRKSILWKLLSDGYSISTIVLNSLSGGTTTNVAGLSNSTIPVIAGSSGTAAGDRAVVWSGAGTVSDLGVNPAMNSSISAVSPSGVLAGVWNNPSFSSTSQCFIARPGSTGQWQIETQGSVQSYVSVLSVNNFGEVHGLSRAPGSTAAAVPTIWRTGSGFLVSNALPPAYSLTSVISCNANGSLLAQVIKGGSQIYILVSQDVDTDADGIPDAYENEHGFNAFSTQDASLDADGDGLSNAEEFRRGTDPRKIDTDGDGMDDKWELDWGLDPLNGEDAYLDPDGDGVTNAREYVIKTRPTGLFKTEVVPLASDEYYTSIDDEGSVVTYRPNCTIKDRNYTDIPNVTGWAYNWRGRLSAGAARVERRIPFGDWDPSQFAGNSEYHSTYVRSLGGGKIAGTHMAFGGADFQPLANGINLFTFDAKASSLIVKDWSTITGVFVPSTGWGATPLGIATSPSGNFIAVQGSSSGKLLDPLGVGISSMPYQNPLTGYTSVTWKAINNNGDAVGLLTPGNQPVWRKAGSSSPVIPISEPVEWGTDAWELGNAITDDDLTILSRNRPGDNGTSSMERYFYDLNSGEATLINRPGASVSESIASVSTNGRVLGSGSKPWMISNGATILLEGLQVTSTTGAAAQKFSQLGWTIESLNNIDPQGRMTLTVRTSTGARQIAILNPVLDENGDGVPDDYEIELRSHYASSPTQSLPSTLDPDTDYDGDGYTLRQEIAMGTSDASSSSQPSSGSDTTDRDGDGVPDIYDADPDDRVINWHKSDSIVKFVRGPEILFGGDNSTYQTRSTSVLESTTSNQDNYFIVETSEVGNMLYGHNETPPSYVNGNFVAAPYQFTLLTAEVNGNGRKSVRLGRITTLNAQGDPLWGMQIPLRTDINGGVYGYAVYNGENGGGFEYGNYYVVKWTDGVPLPLNERATSVGFTKGYNFKGQDLVRLDDSTIIKSGSANWEIDTHIFQGGVWGFLNDGMISMSNPAASAIKVYRLGGAAQEERTIPPPFGSSSIEYRSSANLVIDHNQITGEALHEKRDLILTNRGLYVAQPGGVFQQSRTGGTASFASKQGWIVYKEDAPPAPDGSPRALHIWINGKMQPIEDLIDSHSVPSGQHISVIGVLNMTETGVITVITRYINENAGGGTSLGKFAIINLIPVELDISSASQTSSSAANIAAPDDFRKISLSGIQKAEAKPQGESEDDAQAESTYVDSYTRLLRHDTSHVYQSVPASDLSLQATMSWDGAPISIPLATLQAQVTLADLKKRDLAGNLTRQIEESMKDKVGLFGASWTTNLDANAKLHIETIPLSSGTSFFNTGSDPTLNPAQRQVTGATATVTDESGRVISFSSSNMISFSPLYSRFPGKSDLGMTLKRETGSNGDYLVLRKKFGTTCRYSLPSNTPAWHVGSTVTWRDGVSYVAPLVSVADRYDNKLEYGRSGPGNSIYNVVATGRGMGFSYHVASLSKSTGHTQYQLIDTVTDPLNQITRFGYDWTNVMGAMVPVLATVTKPDGSVQTYGYSTRIGSLGSYQDINRSPDWLKSQNAFEAYDPESRRKIKLADIKNLSDRTTSMFCHINLVSITNPVGAKWKIDYEGSPKSDVVNVNATINPSVSHCLIDLSPGSGGDSPSAYFVPSEQLEGMRDQARTDLLDDAEKTYAKQGGNEIKTLIGNKHTGLFALPAVDGPDVVKTVTLPDGSATQITSAIIGGTIPAEFTDPNANTAVRVDASFPVMGAVRKPGYTKVTDAVGNITEYTVTGPIFLASKNGETGNFKASRVQNDPSRIAFQLLAYDTLVIKSSGRGLPGSPSKEATYQFDPGAGFALWKTKDHQGKFLSYTHEETVTAAPAASPTPFGESGWERVQPTIANPEAHAPAGTKFPEPKMEVDGEIGTIGGAVPAGVLTKTFTYDAESRKMKTSTDRQGNYTVDTIDSLGRRTKEKCFDKLNNQLSEQNFEYANSAYPAFVTKSTVTKLNVSEPAWVQDLVTVYTADSYGHIATQTTYPGGGVASSTTHFDYDAAGRKKTETDPKGNVTTFNYDNVGRLTKVIYPPANDYDASGSQSLRASVKTFGYDPVGRKVRETDEMGHSTLWEYDLLGRVTASGRDMNSNGRLDSTDIVTRTVYNSVGLPVTVTDPNGGVTTTSYDELLRPISVTDALGGITRMAYDEAGAYSGSGLANGPGYKPTRIRNPRGYLTIRKYEEHYRLESEEVEFLLPANLPEGESGDGWKTRTLDRAHATLTKTTYDTNGNPTVVESYRTATNLLQTKTDYDGLNRAVSVTTGVGQGSLENITTTTYSSTGLKKETVAYSGIAALERHTENEYDGAGRLTKVWSPNPVDGSVTHDPAVNGLTNTAYDANGNVTSNTSYRGTTTATAANGAITTTAATSATTTTTYDARNRPINIYSSAASVYNPAGSGSFSDLEAHVTKAYDAVGNAVTVTDPRGQVTLTEYDANNRATDVTAANGTTIAATTSTAYDKNGNIVAVTDPNNAVTRNQYDRLNRLVATAVNPTTGSPSANLNTPAIGDVTVRNTYDAAGNLVSVLDGEGVYWGPNSAHTTDFSYDGLNRKIAQTWDKGTQSWGSYTPKGTLHWTYDALVMTQSANARGETTSYEYDGLLRPVTLTYSNAATTPLCRLYYQGASTATPAAGYASGPGPLVASLHPSSGSSLYQDTLTTYDRLDRVLAETSAGETHSYSYDVAGNRVLTTYAKTGRKLVTQYDKLGRVTRIIDTAGNTTDPASYAPGGTDLVTSYAYDIGGLVLRKNQANHTATLNTYDLRGRLSTTRTRYYPPGGGGTNADLSAFDYSQPQSGDTAHTSGYDTLGNVIHVVETYSGLPARDVLNSYDRTNRLTTEQDTDSGHITLTSYTYTENNSRYDRTVRIDSGPSHTTRFRYGNPNIGYNSDQLYGISKLDVNAQPGDDSTFKYRYTYDADGNRATRVTDPGTAAEKVDHYVYDQRNRLIAVTTTQTSSGAVVGSNGYAYDERTRRTATTEGYPATATRRLSFSGGSYVQEYGSNPASLPTLQLVRGSDMGGGVGGILYNDGASGVTFNNYNSRGDVVSQTNTGGASTWAGKYDAFGTHTDTSTTSAVGRQRANSKDEDPTGLLNEGMRYRDLEAAVFLTRDPAGLVDGPNVYTYVNQNPWTKFDPEGLTGYDGGDDPREHTYTSNKLISPGYGWNHIMVDSYNAKITGNWGAVIQNGEYYGSHGGLPAWPATLAGIDPEVRHYQDRIFDGWAAAYVGMGAGGTALPPAPMEIAPPRPTSGKATQAGSSSSEEVPGISAKGVKDGEVSNRADLKAREEKGDGLDIHEAPSRAAVKEALTNKLGRPPTDRELKDATDRLPAIAIPPEVHAGTPSYFNKNTRSKVKADAENLDAASKEDAEYLSGAGYKKAAKKMKRMWKKSNLRSELDDDQS